MYVRFYDMLFIEYINPYFRLIFLTTFPSQIARSFIFKKGQNYYFLQKAFSLTKILRHSKNEQSSIMTRDEVFTTSPCINCRYIKNIVKKITREPYPRTKMSKILLIKFYFISQKPCIMRYLLVNL